jgi:translocation and assembly module TamB
VTPRRRRFLVAGLSAVALVAVVLAGSWWLFFTQPGAKWGFERLGSFFPGRLDVRDMTGPLRGPLIVRHFTYRNDRLAITADSVFIDWRLRELWRRRLDIHNLYAKNARIVVGGPGDTPEAQDSLRGLPDLNLPVTVIVRNGVVNGLTLARPGSDSGLVIDQVRLDARSMRRDSVRVNALMVRSRTIDLDFSGSALPRGAYPLALRGQWTYRPAGSAPVRGDGTLTGTLEALRVRQSLKGPFDAQVDVTLIRPLRRQIRFRGDVEFARLTPRDFGPAWPQGVFDGHVALDGAVRSASAQGRVRGTTEALGPTAANFRVRRLERGDWQIDDLVVTQPRAPARVTARGTLSGDSASARFDLRTEWAAMGWPLRGKRWVESERGSARVRGTMADFDVHSEALLAGRNVPPGHWTLDGRGGNGRLAVHTVIANIFGGRITGSGSVAWQPGVSWRLSFDGRGIDPGTVWRAYPGRLDFAGRSEGVNGPSGPSGRILVSRLNGTVRNQPVTAAGTLVANRGQYRLDRATATWGPDSVQASGAFGRSFDLAWRVSAPKLGAVLAQASGSLEAQGTIRGTWAHPHIAGTVTGDSLFFANERAGALRADGDVDLRPGGIVRLDLSASRVSAGIHAADRMIVTARGTRERHEWRASVAGRADSTVAVLAGGFAAGGWRGTIARLDLVNPRSGNWSLAAPARLTAVNGRVTVTDFNWQSGTSRIVATADWARRGPWHADARLEQVNLTLLQPGLPPRLRLSGTMAGHVSAHGNAEGQLFADVDVVPGPGEILHETADGRWVPTRFRNARLTAVADGRRVQTTLAADLVNVGTVRGNLGWPAYGSFAEGTSRPIDGRLALHLRDLSLAQGLTPEVDATSGTLDADLAIAGTVQRPFLYGPLTLRNGSANIPRYGLQLREMNVEGRGSPGGAIELHGSVRSGSGTLAIDGTAAVARGARPVATVTVKGNRVQAMNTRDMQVVASPDLKFALNGNRLDITGEVDIPEGTISIGRADERRLVKTSPDVVFTGADTLSEMPTEVHTRVRLVMGDKVRVTGFGLDVRPTGSVVAIDTPGLPTLGSGRLDIKDGTYHIYGQDLAVETGTLIFAGGPITDPAVRARATRTAADGTVAGFLVSGTVMKPDVQVFSEPAMGQSEALSYIMFGKPIESANLSEGQMASTLASTMGVPGTNLLAQGVASELGIEQARLDVGTSLQSTSLSLGTHLSPKLYVSAGMDVFQSTSSLRLRYILNRIFTIEAETARQNRVDILYTVEP